jgi:hypothetical protein
MLVGLDVWNEPSRSFAIPGRSIERAAVGYDCKFNPLALGQIQNGADTKLALLWQIVDFAVLYRIPESIFQ